MASAGFMIVKANGEDIHGEPLTTTLDRENSISIAELAHDVNVPVDATSGSTSGRRQHSPLRVTARVDKALPQMYQAWAQNAECEVELKFYRPNVDNGAEEEYFNITLRRAAVSSIKLRWPNLLERDSSTIPEYVEYAFTYHTIVWKNMVGNREFEDTWRQPQRD